MKSLPKVLSALLVGAVLTANSYAAYETVSCDSNGAFGANSCDQCFDGGTAVTGDTRGLLTDVWDNTSPGTQIVFKEEQQMPQMISLGDSSWTEVKASDGVDFWQYTPEFDALYNDSEGGYTLDAGGSVTWIESTLGSAYELVSSNVAEGQNIGMIVYDLKAHNMSDGTVDIDGQEHRECVLIKSGQPGVPPTEVIPPTTLPETGPQHWILGFVALLLAFGIFYFRKKA